MPDAQTNEVRIDPACPLRVWNNTDWIKYNDEDGNFDAPFSQVQAGSGIGKSTTIKWQLEPYKDVWDRALVCSHTAAATHAYDDIVSNPDRQIINYFDDDVAKRVIKRQTRKKGQEKFLLILDDIMGAADDEDEDMMFSAPKRKKSRSQKGLHCSAAMDRLATERRHLDITVVVAEHRFCTMSPTVRESATETFILQQASMKQVKEIAEEYSLFHHPREMVNLILRNTEHYQFLVWKRIAEDRTYNPASHYFVGKAQQGLPPLNIGRVDDLEG
jgi:hypothetical protein